MSNRIATRINNCILTEMAQQTDFSRRSFLATAAVATAGVAFGQTPPPDIDNFFQTFTDDWIRHEPTMTSLPANSPRAPSNAAMIESPAPAKVSPTSAVSTAPA